MRNDNLEYYALIVLQKYIGLNIENAKKREFPDWEVDDVGVEVTRAFLSSDIQFMVWFNKNKYKSKEEVEKINRKKNAFLFFPGDKLRGGASGGLMDVDVYVSRCKQCFLDKIEKLNTNYTLFDTNSLFIFTESFVDDEKIGELFDYINKKSCEFENKFHYIYFFNYEKFYVFDFLSNENIERELSNEDLAEFSEVYEKYLKRKK